MVNAGRVACIFTPFVLTVGALVCVVLVFIAGSHDKSTFLDDLYFLKIDLSNFTLTNEASNLIGGNNPNNTVVEGALDALRQALDIRDYYTIYLRGYCAWNGNDLYANCTSPQTSFWFDPLTVFNLESNTTAQNEDLPQELRDALNTYQKVSHAMSAVYIIALSATAATLVVGITAIFSRWGSFVTSCVASAAGIFFLAGSIIATALYAVLTGALNKEFEQEFGIKSDFGTKGAVVSWIGTAFAVGGAFFWLLSVCCCSGRSPYNPGGKDARRTRAEKTPYTYERVGSPYLGPQDHQAVPLNNFRPEGFGPGHQGYSSGPTAQRQTAYEPFRPQAV